MTRTDRRLFVELRCGSSTLTGLHLRTSLGHDHAARLPKPDFGTEVGTEIPMAATRLPGAVSGSMRASSASEYFFRLGHDSRSQH